jgi:hypothetical protein
MNTNNKLGLYDVMLVELLNAINKGKLTWGWAAEGHN